MKPGYQAAAEPTPAAFGLRRLGRNLVWKRLCACLPLPERALKLQTLEAAQLYNITQRIDLVDAHVLDQWEAVLRLGGVEALAALFDQTFPARHQ